MRAADFVIGRSGHPYLNRWWVIPRNRYFNVYLHQIIQDDDDRAMHDHPWINCSIILKGAYREHTPSGSYLRKRGSVTFRRAVAIHRLTIADGPVGHYSLPVRLFVNGDSTVRRVGGTGANSWIRAMLDK